MTADDFRRWLERYGRAWEEGSPEAALALFAPDAAYHETPFEAPMVGREAIRRYWTEGAQDGQRDVRFKASVIAVVGGDIGVAHWAATFRRVPSGIQVALDGVLQARFDAAGRCVEFREWWHRRES